MNASNNTTIDWSNPNVLYQIMNDIKNPIEKIMETSKRNMEKGGFQDEVIFSSSKQIKDVIEQILEEIQSKSVNLTVKQAPEIFFIYESNKNVQKMCTNELVPEKITKTDQDWLLNLEKEIYSSIKQNDINIYDLSYKMAVSERQLYRKITNLIYLTPNKYIRVLRLHKAKQIIENYIQHSISQIAYAVGYNDVHYFSKLFLEQYEITPRELIATLK
jgi:AraC-like DNA-binding protein